MHMTYEYGKPHRRLRVPGIVWVRLVLLAIVVGCAALGTLL